MVKALATRLIVDQVASEIRAKRALARLICAAFGCECDGRACIAHQQRLEIRLPPNDQIAAAYAKWDAGDLDGLLAHFADDAKFFVPGATTVSGDHDKASFRRVLEDVAKQTAAGRHRQELICTYQADDGAMWLFDNHVTINGKNEKYHSVHEWGFRDERPAVWMLYVHEYDIFDRAWS